MLRLRLWSEQLSWAAGAGKGSRQVRGPTSRKWSGEPLVWVLVGRWERVVGSVTKAGPSVNDRVNR